MNRKYLLLRITIAITTVAFGLVPSGGRFAAVSGEHEEGESQTPGSRLPNLKAPAGELPDTRHVVVDEFDGAVIPSGRFITPAGVEVNVGAPKPFGMALSPDGNTLATINSGIGPFSISLISDLKTPVPAVTLVNVNTVPVT